jgi:serine/threonine-protein kinase
MSPEQMRSSRDVDARTDIWALGVIFFELVAGVPPFDGSSLTEVAVKVATEPPPLLRALRPDFPPALDDVIACCLQKDPRARYAHVGELAAALAPFASPRGRSSFERISGVLASPQRTPLEMRHLGVPATLPVAAETVPPVGRTASERTPRKVAIAGIAGAIAAVVVLGGGAAVALRLAKHPAPPPAAESAPMSMPASAVPAASETASAAALAPRPDVLPPRSDAEPSAAVHGPHLEGKPKAPANAHNVSAGAGHDASPPPAAPPSANCNPPYFIDSAGHRQYKPECL